MNLFEVLPKPLSAIRPVVADFVDDLAAGETLLSASCAVAVWSGADASPNSIKSGSATVSGKTAAQKITAGTVGVVYSLGFAATTSLGNTFFRTCLLPVVADIP